MEIVRETESVCNTCVEPAPANVVVRDGGVFLDTVCKNHGTQSTLLSRSPDTYKELDDYYFSVMGKPGPQRDYIVRMTETCNLDCPICLAKANTEDTPDLDLGSLEEMLRSRRGLKIDLMAAEPTVRKDLEEWIRKVKAAGHTAALHTNGLRLQDLDYCKRLKAAGVDEVYLQFDGFDDEVYKVLRGRPLLDIKMKTLNNLRTLDIPTSLIMVIARDLNEREVPKCLDFVAKPENDFVRELFFLGLRMLGSARASGLSEAQTLMPDEIIDIVDGQTKGRIDRDSVIAFQKVYFSLLAAFNVRKCFYVQHYIGLRDRSSGELVPFADIVDLKNMDGVFSRFQAILKKSRHAAAAYLTAELARRALNRRALKSALDLIKLEADLKRGMDLAKVPRDMLLLGFITACDPANYDAQISAYCGKGEVSSDGGFTDSGADANVEREARFDATGRSPSFLKTEKSS